MYTGYTAITSAANRLFSTDEKSDDKALKTPEKWIIITQVAIFSLGGVVIGIYLIQYYNPALNLGFSQVFHFTGLSAMGPRFAGVILLCGEGVLILDLAKLSFRSVSKAHQLHAEKQANEELITELRAEITKLQNLESPQARIKIKEFVADDDRSESVGYSRLTYGSDHEEDSMLSDQSLQPEDFHNPLLPDKDFSKTLSEQQQQIYSDNALTIELHEKEIKKLKIELNEKKKLIEELQEKLQISANANKQDIQKLQEDLAQKEASLQEKTKELELLKANNTEAMRLFKERLEALKKEKDALLLRTEQTQEKNAVENPLKNKKFEEITSLSLDDFEQMETNANQEEEASITNVKAESLEEASLPLESSNIQNGAPASSNDHVESNVLENRENEKTPEQPENSSDAHTLDLPRFVEIITLSRPDDASYLDTVIIDKLPSNILQQIENELKGKERITFKAENTLKEFLKARKESILKAVKNLQKTDSTLESEPEAQA